MYLRQLEIIGFKSFADRTCLRFDPGMTAIVGPNGCGKSNISDAIRWVIGEQSAKSLRGEKMEDCIFGGTEERKPLGMAEVSITFSDCETTLGTEYNEVTVTRRVFRSGEGQYFLNRQPCRLRDIQQLFMNTGIGTTSYSVMEQGRLDRVLSSRPEDRRAIFEEASGITKFKADRREAMRKLERVEENLLRLADVIREIKRQIGSLQRQAGKARRYQSLKAELRSLDIYVAKQRIAASDMEIASLERHISKTQEALTRQRDQVEILEAGAQERQTALTNLEREIGATMEKAAQAQSQYDHNLQIIGINEARIREYGVWSERDTREAEALRARLDERRSLAAELEERLVRARADAVGAETKLKEAQSVQEENARRAALARAQLQRLRSETIEIERALSRLQNELTSIDSRVSARAFQRERLAAEIAQLEEALDQARRRREETRRQIDERKSEVGALSGALFAEETGLNEIRALEAELLKRRAAIQSEMAAQRARVEMLGDPDRLGETFPSGARAILDKGNSLKLDTSHVVGPLAEGIQVDPKWAIALEAALRPWSDALVVRTVEGGRNLLAGVLLRRAGSARLLALDVAPGGASSAAPNGARRLMDVVTVAPELAPAVERLIGHVLLTEQGDSIPLELAGNCAYVTSDGLYVDGRGPLEVWSKDTAASNPLSARNALLAAQAGLASLRTDAETVEREFQETHARRTASAERIGSQRDALTAAQRALAQREGEAGLIDRDERQAGTRLDAVRKELQTLEAHGSAAERHKSDLVAQIETQTHRRDDAHETSATQGTELAVMEEQAAESNRRHSDCRLAFMAARQQVEHLESQSRSAMSQIEEMVGSIARRTEAVMSYGDSVEKLKEETVNAQAGLGAFERALGQHRERLSEQRARRLAAALELEQAQRELADARQSQERVRDERGRLDVSIAEAAALRAGLVERVLSDYHLDWMSLLKEPDPEWPESAPPPLANIEASVAEYRERIEAIGPVNLVAIEEHTELEERFAFMSGQEQDLLKAKEHLEETIRRINRTSSERFRQTFDQVNTNFQAMFRTLFNGGSAELVLVDDRDILDCGIEIVAKPPGKRLQSISLLSGGERTLTAVALLFGIYQIKPSPFCLLDELDAPLDEVNIGRFIQVLQGFLAHSQFLIITHSRKTIAAANAIYGVSMAQKGISSMVSIKFTPMNKPDIATDELAGASLELDTSSPKPAVGADA